MSQGLPDGSMKGTGWAGFINVPDLGFAGRRSWKRKGGKKKNLECVLYLFIIIYLN